MTKELKKSKKELELEAQNAELTADLQRTRADFENYRKRVDIEKSQAKESGQFIAIMQILPMIDNIERAISFLPDDLKDNTWAQGVIGLSKNLEKSIENMNLKRIDAKVGVAFNPDLHDAIQFDEEAVGDKEIVAEELVFGYTFNGNPVRHAMVKVTRK